MSKCEPRQIEQSEARAVIEEFLTGVHVEAALFLDLERQLLESAKLNPNVLPTLSNFNSTLKTNVTLQWLFARTDMQASVSAMLEKLGVTETRIF